VLVFAFLAFGLVSFRVDLAGSLGGGDLDKQGMRQNQMESFVEPVSGENVWARDSVSAARGILAASCDSLTLVSVVRWELNGDFHFVCEYLSPADTIAFSRRSTSPEGRLTSDLADFIINKSKAIEETFLNGNLPPFGNQEQEVDGLLVSFKKWEARHPLGQISFWYGEPIRRQGQPRPQRK
jgi:hypothetical protein